MKVWIVIRQLDKINGKGGVHCRAFIYPELVVVYSESIPKDEPYKVVNVEI